MSGARARSPAVSLALATLLAACASPERSGAVVAPALLAADRPPDAGAPPGCRFDREPFDPDVLRERVGFLASEALAGRAAGSEGDRAARAYIEARLACLGLQPGAEGAYQQPFVDGAGQSTANVIAVLPGSDAVLRDQLVVVGAHHDHLGAPHGQRYPGANDNASGVATMLAVAQLAAERERAPRRTIVFVAFGAEESGLRGSTHYVAHPPTGLPVERVVYLVNLDMVGSHDSTKKVYALGAFRGLPGRALLETLAPRHRTLGLRYGVAGRGSDHQPFCDAGVPYIFFWTPDRTCYHERCDEAGALAYAPMSEIGALAGELVLGLADSDDDLLASRRRHGCGTR